MMTHDDSTLIAYVDGELDASTAREVEHTLSANTRARQYVEHLREIAALSKIAFNDCLHETVPQALKDTILGQKDNQNATVVAFTPRPKSTWNLALPMAAAVAMLLLGLGGGYQYSETATSNAIKLAALTQRQDQIAMNGTLNQALEVNLSGMPRTWSNPDSHQSVAFTPVRTYQDKSGTFCREYRKDATSGNRKKTTFGLACRTDQGTWKTRYLIMENGMGRTL